MFDFLRNLTKSEADKRREMLSAYLDEVLTGEEKSQFEDRLRSDSGLRAELEQIRWLKHSMQSLPRSRAPRNFTLDPALYGKPVNQFPAQIYPVLRTATVVAALVFVFLISFDLVSQGTSDSSSASPLALFQPAGEEADFFVEEEPAEEIGASQPADMAAEALPAELPFVESVPSTEVESAAPIEMEPAVEEGVSLPVERESEGTPGRLLQEEALDLVETIVVEEVIVPEEDAALESVQEESAAAEEAAEPGFGPEESAPGEAAESETLPPSEPLATRLASSVIISGTPKAAAPYELLEDGETRGQDDVSEIEESAASGDPLKIDPEGTEAAALIITEQSLNQFIPVAPAQDESQISGTTASSREDLIPTAILRTAEIALGIGLMILVAATYTLRKRIRS